MTLWFSQLPSWLSFAILVGGANAVALAATFAARRWSHGLGVLAGPPVVNSWATCAGALCGVLFAFSIVTLWNGWTRAHADMDDESSAVRLTARDLAPDQHVMLRTYVNDTVAEWPRLCGGEPLASVDDSLIVLERTARPRTPAYADDLYRQLGTLEDMRNRRWQSASSSIPTEVLVALGVLSVALLLVLALALPDRLEFHIALMIVVATSVGTLLWVVSILEYPFCGVHGIGPGELLSIVRAHLM